MIAHTLARAFQQKDDSLFGGVMSGSAAEPANIPASKKTRGRPKRDDSQKLVKHEIVRSCVFYVCC